MGRVRGYIDVGDRRLWALFETGARNSYIMQDAVGGLPTWTLVKPLNAPLGGASHTVRSECALVGGIEGYDFSVKARVIEDLGVDEDGKRIDVLFGARAMQDHGINVDVVDRRLDFSKFQFMRDLPEFSDGREAR